MSQTLNNPGNAGAPSEMVKLLEDLSKAARVLEQRQDTQQVALGRDIKKLVQAGTDPVRVETDAYRQRLAHLVQDTEKVIGPVMAAGGPLREELTQRAVSQPGLENERARQLLQATPRIDARDLTADIRRFAAETARMGTGRQSGPDLDARAEVLENRIRLERRPGAGQSTTRATTEDTPRPNTSRPADRDPGAPPPPKGPDPNSPPDASSARSRGPQGAPTESTIPRMPGAPIEDAGSPRSTRPTPAQSPENAAATGANVGAGYAAGPSVVSRLLGRMAAGVAAEFAERAPTPFSERHASFKQQMQEGRDDKTIASAEKSAEAALRALNEFAQGAGQPIMTKIRDAIKADPNGAQGVFGGMREGGKYADLRREFEGARVKEEAFAASFDRAASALSNYAGQRGEVAAIGQRRGTSMAMDEKFQEIDAKIGQAASQIPGKKPGQNLFEELGEKMRDLVKRAVETVQAVFARADQGSRPSISA